jgi:hypothetical protein
MLGAGLALIGAVSGVAGCNSAMSLAGNSASISGIL